MKTRYAVLVALVVLLLSPWLVQAQNPAQRVIIMDSTGTHAASVAGGNLATSGSASVTVDTISHITSAVHVAGIAQTVAVNCVTGCSASSSTHTAVTQAAAPWTIAHISGVLHVNIRALPRDAHLGAAQSGLWNVTAHQGGEWTVRHVTSVTHVSGTGNAGALHISGISNIGSGTPSSGTTPMACHSSVAFSTTSDLVLAHSQNSWRIYICSILVVSAGAESVSITEGTGSACATGTRGIIGGFGGTMSLAANGGFSSISPFPWTSSSVAGNQVCLDKSGSGNVSGTITYRAAP